MLYNNRKKSVLKNKNSININSNNSIISPSTRIFL